MSPDRRDITGLLQAWAGGDDRALEELAARVDAELRQLARRFMRREQPGHPLQTTALINETYLRLIEGDKVSWQNRAHFFALAARVMRRILVDDARSRGSLKRGGGAVHVPLEETAVVSPGRRNDVLALDEALRSLETLDPRKGRVVELRYFGGLSVEETAEVLEVSAGTVLRDWRIARAWLRRELTGEAP